MLQLRLLVAALLVIVAVGQFGIVLMFRQARWRTESVWAVQALVTEILAALLLLHAAWEGR